MAIVPEGNTCPDATAQQVLIDEKIAHLQECIRQLNSQRNELSPVSRLPPEILGFIFCLISPIRIRRSPRFFYNFTHVSQSWRSVALNTPNIWRILSEKLPWAIDILERSKGADLVVRWQIAYGLYGFSVLKEILTKHASRIRALKLKLTMVRTPTLTTLFENLPQSSLRLHSLKLRCFDAGRPTFPTGIMQTENLQTLEVNDCDGPWYSLSLLALTNLKLYCIANRPPLIEFLNFLRVLPALKVLDLQDSLPSTNDLVGLTGLVGLPNLRFLCLSSSTDHKEVTNILPLLIVPPTATLKLIATIWLTSFQDFQTLLDELESSFSIFFGRLGQSNGLSYSILDVRSMGLGHVRLRAWREDGSIPTPPDLELSLHISGQAHTSLNSAQDMLQRILPSLSLFSITTLNLGVWPEFGLEDAFGHLPHLQNVKVDGDRITDFIKALTHKPKNYNTEPSAYYSVSFPALQSLWIHAFLFTGTCIVEELLDCLIERCERRAERLLKLKFTHCCGLQDKDLERLREIVNDVGQKWPTSTASDKSDTDGSEELSDD